MANEAGAIRILVVGDSGVGKTSFTYAFAHKSLLKNPTCTVGCQIEIKVHSHNGAQYDVELWDVGGSPGHRQVRSMFYCNIHGIVLVHDLTNRKSYNNLDKWANEILDVLSGRCMLRSTESEHRRDWGVREDAEGIDLEGFIGDPSSVPMIIVGTKADAATGSSKRQLTGTYGESINVSCVSASDFLPDSPSGRQLNAFLDRVISRKRGVSRTPVYTSSVYGASEARIVPPYTSGSQVSQPYLTVSTVWRLKRSG